MALTKIGSIGINTGIAFAGVTTITTLNGSDAVLSVGGTVNFNSDVSIGGSVSIGGTLTYEDVTNIDSVGLITARNGIVVGSGITLSKDGDGFFTGVVTATSYAGDGSGLTGIDATQIVTGNTSVQTVDTGSDGHVKVNTEGSERLRIDPAGRVLIGGTSAIIGSSSEFNEIVLTGKTRGAGITLQDVDANTRFQIRTDDNGDGTLLNASTNHPIAIRTNNTERLRIDSNGRLLINKTSDRNAYYGGTLTGNLQVEGTDNASRLTQFIHNSNAASQHILVLGKSRGTSVGSYTVVQNSDYLGTLSFQGADGDAMIEGARIDAIVTAAPGDQDMPTALTFGTTADGASSTTERLRIASSGDVTVSTGNLVIGTAGKGIDFSAQTATSVSGASATAEVLDHYEEGTWTPSFLNVTVTGYGHQSGTYTRIGRAVHCQFQISVDSGLDTSDTSAISIGGLPFSGNSAHEACVFSFGKLTSILPNARLAEVTNFRFGGNFIQLHRGSDYDLNYSLCNSSGHLQGAFTYQMS